MTEITLRGEKDFSFSLTILSPRAIEFLPRMRERETGDGGGIERWREGQTGREGGGGGEIEFNGGR